MKNAKVKATIVAFFYQADPEYGARVGEAVGVTMEQMRPFLTSVKESTRR